MLVIVSNLQRATEVRRNRLESRRGEKDSEVRGKKYNKDSEDKDKEDNGEKPNKANDLFILPAAERSTALHLPH